MRLKNYILPYSLCFTLIIMSLCLPRTAAAQNNDTSPADNSIINKKLFITAAFGVGGSLGLYNSNFMQVCSQSGSASGITINSSNCYGAIAYTGRIGFQYYFNKNVGMELDVQGLFNRGLVYQISSTQSGVVNISGTLTNTYQYPYIQFPLLFLAQYSVLNNKLDLQGQIGIAPAVLLGATTQCTSTAPASSVTPLIGNCNTPAANNPALNTINFDMPIIIRMGADYRIGSAVRPFVMVEFQLGLINVLSSSYQDEYFSSSGAASNPKGSDYLTFFTFTAQVGVNVGIL